jgi:predicted RNA-binding Zn ribbon-like protein
VELDSYLDAGVFTAVLLINGLTPGNERGRPRPPVSDPLGAVRTAIAIDPPSVARLTADDLAAFTELAERLREVFVALDGGDVDGGAAAVNGLLAEHAATPHLAKEDGRWRLHHHPVDVDVVPMFTAICAEAVARFIGAGHGERLGVCRADACDRVFVDGSRNGSRRFCSTACQNRVKTAAFRRRQAAPAG